MDPVLKCWVGPMVLTWSALVQCLTSVKAETYIYIVVVALFFMFMMYSYFAIISKLNMTKFYMQEWVGFPHWNECMQLDGKGLTQLIKMVDAFPAQTRRQHLFGVLHPWVYFLHGGDGTPYYSCSPCYIWLPPAWMKTITKKHRIQVHCKPNASVPRVSSAIHFGHSGAHSTDLYRISCRPEWKYFSYLVSSRVLEMLWEPRIATKNTLLDNAKK